MSILQRLSQLSGFVSTAAPLSDKHKKLVDKTFYSPHHSFSDHAMGGADKHRVEVPLKEAHIIPPKKITKALGKAGFKSVNYGKGVAKDKYGRDVKIGKALNKAGHKDLLEHYEKDPQRAAQGQHKVVISRHPHDVAGMSTNQGWTSCMDLNRSFSQKKHLKDDVQHGTHVAYLVHKDDHNLEHPIARVALKPHVSEGGHTILRPENKVYGTSNSNFHKTVTEWAHKHFPTKASVYKKHKKLYNDDNKNTVIHPRKIGKEARDTGKLGPHFKQLTAEEKNKEIQKSANPKLINQFFRQHPTEVHPHTYQKALAKGVKISSGAHEALKHIKSKVRDERVAEDRKKGKTPGPEPKESHGVYSHIIKPEYHQWLHQHTNKELKNFANHHDTQSQLHRKVADAAVETIKKDYVRDYKPGETGRLYDYRQTHPLNEKAHQHRDQGRTHFEKAWAARHGD